MNQGLIIHCPRCGSAIHVTPDVDQISFHSTTMRATFRHVNIEHTCDRNAA